MQRTFIVLILICRLISSWACENITDNILDQYETLQCAVIYLQQTRENNLKVHMTVYKKDIVAFLPKPNLGARTVYELSFYLRTPLDEY